jgi:replicative DNA helicase
MNVEAVVIYLLLKSKSREEALTRYSDLRAEFFSTTYIPLIRAIERFYQTKGIIPTIDLLELDCSRNIRLSTALAALKSLEISEDENDYDLAVEILKDQFTQKKYLELLNDSLNDISIKTSTEIVDLASTISLKLEEVIKPSSYMRKSSEIMLFKSKEEIAEDTMFLGISNKFDSEYGAARRGEVLLIGGRRGAGKSVICTNITQEAVLNGFIVPYFALEMTGEETKQRHMAIASGVKALKIRNQSYNIEDLDNLVLTLCKNYINGKELYNREQSKLIDFNAYIEFEKLLYAEGIPDDSKGDLIVIDDTALKLSSIDNYLTRLKSRYGKRVGPVIIDYVNQIVMDGTKDIDMYNWTVQILIAKKLKELAKKHNITIFAPYQIDESGEARMAKGILDSCDFAYTVKPIHVEGKDIGLLEWTGTKARGLPTFNFKVKIDWSTLKIYPNELSPIEILEIIGEEANEEKPKKNNKKKSQNEIEDSMELKL